MTWHFWIKTRWFFHYVGTKTFASSWKIRIFGPKATKFGPKYAFLVILGQILAFLAHVSNARPKYNVNKVLRWVFCYVGNKLLISPVEKGIFCPKTAKFGSKLAFLVNLGQGMHLVPCWCVGWWLWRAGCISQDTYLLYLILLFISNSFKHCYSHQIIKNIFLLHCWSSTSCSSLKGMIHPIHPIQHLQFQETGNWEYKPNPKGKSREREICRWSRKI